MLQPPTLTNENLNSEVGTRHSWHKKIKQKASNFRENFENCNLDDPKVEKSIGVTVAAAKVTIALTTGVSIPTVIPVSQLAKDALKGSQFFSKSMRESEHSGSGWLKRAKDASKHAWKELNKDGWEKNVKRYAGAAAKGLIAESVFDSLVSNLEPFLEPVITEIQSNTELVTDGLKSITQPLTSGVESLIEPAINEIQSTSEHLTEGFKSITQPLISGAESLVDHATSEIQSNAESIIDGFKAMTDQVASDLETIVEPVMDDVQSAAKIVSEEIGSIGEPLLSELKTILASEANESSILFPSDNPLAAFAEELLTDNVEELIFNGKSPTGTDSGTSNNEQVVNNGQLVNESTDMSDDAESISEVRIHDAIPRKSDSNPRQSPVTNSSLTGQQPLGGNNTMHETKRDYSVLSNPVLSNAVLFDEDVTLAIKKLEDSITLTNDAIHTFIDKSKELVALKGGQFIKDFANVIKESYNERVGFLHKGLDDYANDYRKYLNNYHEEEAERDEHEQLIKNTISAFDKLKAYNSDIPDGPASSVREEEERELISNDLKNAANICANANEVLFKLLLDFVQNREIECVSFGVCNFAVPYMIIVDELADELLTISTDGEMKRQERSEDAKKVALAAADARIATTAKEQLERSNKTKAAWNILGQKKK